MERVNQHLNSANVAMAAGDMRATMDGFIAAVIDFPHKNHRERYNILQVFGLSTHMEGYKLTEQTISILEERLLNNEEEPTLYRAHAACYLANYSLHETCTDGIVYFKRILNLCDGASSQERRATVSRRVAFDFEGVECSVGEILDSLRGLALEAIELRLRKNHYPSEAKVEAFQNLMMAIQGPNGKMVKRTEPLPPAITSAVIEQVKALPEKDVTFLILPDADVYTLPGINSKHHCFQVFKVDLDNFHSGRKTNIFNQILFLACDPLQSRQKNILSTFVLSCLEPYVHVSITLQRCSSARPRQVLLESKADANDPHVRRFLFLMGCTVVEAASSALLALLEETCRQDAPHLSDYHHGIKCGNCGIYGPKVKPCPCREAYYCSTQCQHAKWEEHKSEHKSAIARKNARKKKKNAKKKKKK
jgi:hypothetical protein